MSEINFMNLTFKGLTRKALLEDNQGFKIVVTVNAEFIVLANQDPAFKKIICDNYATFDGQIPYILAKRQFPDVEIEKISGSDFVYDLCAHAKKLNKRIFLLGGYKASNRGAVEVLKDKYGIEIEGFSPPYQPYPFSDEHNEVIIRRIREFAPHYLFVGFGAKKQEMWIVEHRDSLTDIGVQLAIGVGGTFEFVSSTIKRAPVFLQKIGLEGLYRFLMEPSLARLRRLFVSLLIFRYYFANSSNYLAKS